eukprot:2854639-Pleurochrysis_carterae.AAC.1
MLRDSGNMAVFKARQRPRPRLAHSPLTSMLFCSPVLFLFALEDHGVRHDELVFALVLAQQQRHILLVPQLELIREQRNQ